MKNKSLMNKIVAGLVAGGILLSASGLVYANTLSNSSSTTTSSSQHQMRDGKEMNGQKSEEFMKAELDKLVTAGTISAETETKIVDFMKQKSEERKAEMDKVKAMTDTERKAYFAANPKEKTDLFAELVTAGTLTQAQADAIKSALPAREEMGNRGHGPDGLGAPEDRMKTQLDTLVKSATITQEQEDKIIAFEKGKQDERKTEMDKVKAMTETERKAYFAANPKERTDLFAELVTAGILTQAQADTIKSTMPARGEMGDPGQGPDGSGAPGERMKTQLDSLVKSATITQEQEDKIIAFETQKQADRKAEMDKVKAMTDTERKAYFAANPKEKTDLFAELVTAGILTQAQADTIKKDMPQGKGHHEINDKMPTSTSTTTE